MAGKVRIKRGADWAARLKEHLTTSQVGAAEWMEEHTQILRSNVDTLSGLLQLDDALGYLKLYSYKPHKYTMSLGLRKPQPLRNFAIATELADKGVPVPRPLACLAVSQGMLILTEGLSGGGNLAELWRNQTAVPDADAMMRAAGATLAQLHVAGYTYGDCRWEHLYWNGQRVYLITLDNTRKSPLGSIQQAQDLARFTAHAEEFGIGSALFEQFLQTYLQGITGNRREVVERMIRPLYRFRGQHMARYGQRLV
jgi:tRNA A-37 threonylcarbamoyl transferase component Bud32